MPGVVRARLTSETPTCTCNYSGEIANGLIEVIVDDRRVDDITCFRDLLLAKRDAFRDVGFGVAPSTQAFDLCLDRWRHEHDAHDVIRARTHLSCTLKIDLQDEVTVL